MTTARPDTEEQSPGGSTFHESMTTAQAEARAGAALTRAGSTAPWVRDERDLLGHMLSEIHEVCDDPDATPAAELGKARERLQDLAALLLVWAGWGVTDGPADLTEEGGS